MEYPNIQTEKFAEFVGVLLGDGSIGIYRCKASNKYSIQHRVKITMNSVVDLNYTDYLRDIIADMFHIEPIVKFRTNEKALDILIYSKGLVKFLINNANLKLAPKERRAEVPEVYLNNSLELKVLRGLFDTDGCVIVTNNNGTIYPRLELKMVISPMRRQVVGILRRNGFRPTLSPRNNEAHKIRIQLNGQRQLSRWLSLIGFSNPKHAEKLQALYR